MYAVQNDLNIIAALDPGLSNNQLSINNIIMSDTHNFFAVGNLISRVAKLKVNSLDVNPPPCKNAKDTGTVFTCPDCNYTCNTKQQLMLHRFKCSGFKDDIRLKIHHDHTHCYCCFIDFHKRCNLIEHVKKSAHCRAYIEAFENCLSVEQADCVDISQRQLTKELRKKGLGRHHTEKCCIRSIGPLPFSPLLSLNGRNNHYAPPA